MVIDDLKQYDEFVIYGGQKIAVGAMVASKTGVFRSWEIEGKALLCCW
jgi:hypothetical protein